MELEEHLGGHCNKTHTDVTTTNWLKHEHDVKSILDIGCGPGGMQNICESMGIEWFGIDGDHTVLPESNTLLHDFTVGPPKIERTFDCVWSVEFLEHVEDKYIDNFMKAFQLSTNIAVVTAAPPGWPGHHHVNCQLPEYWIEVFDSYGFEYNADLTDTVKAISSMRKPFLQKNGMVFLKK